MKYLRLTCIFIFFACLAAVGQVNQIWYKKGKVLYAVPVAGIDSVTYGQFLSADTFLIVIDRASRCIVYDTVDVHVPGMVYHDTIHTTHTIHLKPGRRIGVFSVAKDKQVSFSQGNLQYVQNQNVWKFADQQYEYIGARNVKDGQLANKIDLFGWSANNTTAPFGVSTSTNNADYSGDFVDWGTNIINYEDPNTWRTLSKDEWEYLINERDKALELYGVANVAGVNGLIILPDNWVLPEGLTFQSGFANGDGDMYFRQHQIFTEEEWLLLETAGAIFLPAAGIVMPPNTIVAPNLGAHYQSSNRLDNDNNYWFGFRSSYYTIQSHECCTLRSVRLVHDTIVPKPSKRIGVFSVAKDRQVSFSQGNLQYVQNQNVWKFADQQYEMIGARNVKDGQLANKIDLFGWSGKDSKIPYGVGSSTKYTEYKGDFVDWGTNVINYESPNTWRTLSIDEWEYIYYERENAQKLIALGTVNDVQGLIILPDNWHLPDGITFVSSVDVGMQWQDGREEGSYFNSSNKDHTKDNIYTEEQWQKMEEAGAVFLPCAGWRVGVNWRKASLAELKTNYVGSYWTSSSLLNNSSYYFFRFTQQEIRKYPFLSDLSLMARGRSVRLVHDTIVPKPSKRIGVFSVAKDRQVSFSQGNLQYVQNQNVWKFADQQYEYIGARNVKDGQLANKIDLFGWSADNTTAPFGVSTSTDVADYAGEFVDWGVNEINGEAPNTWRTLSKDEWEYLFEKRKNAQKLYGVAQVNGSNGIIILPDNWSFDNGISFKTGLHSVETDDYSIFQSFTDQEFSVLESFGAVFIHASGWREGISIEKSQRSGYYWSSTPYNNTDAYRMTFYSYYLKPCDIHYKYRGRSVRLVHDTIVPKPSKRIGVFSVAKDRQVSFSQGNLQYVRNQDIWKFADQQYEYIGARNVKDGELANKIDLFGWSANNATAPFGVSASTKVADYSGDFVDWGVNEINIDAPNTWRTLSQEEWGYIFESRKNAKQLYSKGSIDGVRGMIILPDNWVLPEGLHFTVAPDNLTMDLDINRYTRAQWQKMEEAGAVFLCPTGRRDGLNIGYLVEYGGYWSSSRSGSNRVKHLYFNYQSLVFNTNYNSGDQSYGYNGRAVRLVHDTIVPKPSKRIGVFSVAKDRQVSFSQGNLQYIQSQDKWQFANTQYEYMGERHFRNGQLADTIEYFGWSGKNSNAPWGISLSIELEDYEGEFLDWGTNIISGDTPNTWRTLSNNELIYLCQTRKKASQLLGLGCIGSISGLIILPDDWVTPEGLQFTPNTNDASLNQYTKEQWAIMENAGAVFIPPIGYFNHKLNNMRNVNENGYYRVSTLAKDGRQIYLLYAKDYIRYSFSGNNDGNLFYGFPVRLVHDTIVPPPTPCETFEVNGVKFNMMCVEGGTFMMGAGSDAHQVTLSDYYIGETEVTQSLWLAVMGGELPPRQEIIGDEYPVADITMEDCRRFVERLTELTGRHFRIPTEAEWEYAARGGKKSKGYKYSGSDDITEVAWYNGNSTEYRPQIVKQYKPNELGIYDMSGNVCEWVNDWYAPYNLYPQINPTGASIYSNSKLPHIHRGGCWTYAPAQCQPECRTSWSHKSANGIGLRIVMSDEEPFREVYVNDTIRFYLRLVEGGTFMMGAGSDAHQVTLSDYYMAQYELTQAQWEAVMGKIEKGKYEIEKYGDNYPMTGISLMQCQEFVDRLNKLTGLHFRISTEAEWEYAARGGVKSKGYKYAGSDDINEVAIWNGTVRLDENGKKIYAPEPVMTRKPNELGIYDMSGNVAEWVNDWNGEFNLYPQINPTGPTTYTTTYSHRVHYRGGCWTFPEYKCEVTFKQPKNVPSITDPNRGLDGTGLRLVLSDEEPFKMVYLNDFTRIVLRQVKGGTFMMGASDDDAEAEADEKPQHEVTLSDYYIGQTEVTQQLWEAVMGTNPSSFKGDNLPVESVSWNECQQFVQKLSEMTGLHFRLPTEAEWEYAARGGNRSKGNIYAGSNNADSVAWHPNNCSGLQSVGQKIPNELGLYDMSGNLYEWCSDWYGVYSSEPQINPQGATSSHDNYHIVRGGCWQSQKAGKDDIYYCGVTNRGYAKNASVNIGFRIVLDERPLPPTMPEYVDLGLSVKWATCNVGAESPEDSPKAK